MPEQDVGDIESRSSRTRGRTRAVPEARSVIVAPQGPRRAAVKTARLTVTIDDGLLHECQMLAHHERVKFRDLVADSLRATLNRHTRFRKLFRNSEDVARAIVDDLPRDGEDGQAA